MNANITRQPTLHDIIDVVVATLNARDPYTYEHSWRVAHYSELIARAMKLPEDEVELIHIAAHLHDIGKIGVPDAVLNKTGILTDREWELMKDHSRIGFDIIRRTPLLSSISDAILYHHERWDGKGYPMGIGGVNIPVSARIIAVADSFDAITSGRSYRAASSFIRGLQIITECIGTQFCPEAAAAFLSLKIEDLNYMVESRGRELSLRERRGGKIKQKFDFNNK